MKALAFKVSDYAAAPLTVAGACKQVLDRKGVVWFGRRGRKVAKETIDLLFSDPEHRILLANIRTRDRYWAYIDSVSEEIPETGLIPEYLLPDKDYIGTWFRITKLEPADKDVLAHCITQSGRILGLLLGKSTAPYHVVDVVDEIPTDKGL